MAIDRINNPSIPIGLIVMVEVGILPHDDELVQVLRNHEKTSMVPQTKICDGVFVKTTEAERQKALEEYRFGTFQFSKSENEVVNRYFPEDKFCPHMAGVIRYSDRSPKPIKMHRDLNGDASKMLLLVYLENTKGGGELQLGGNGEKPVPGRVIDTRPTDKGLVYVKFTADEWHQALDIVQGGTKLVVTMAANPR